MCERARKGNIDDSRMWSRGTCSYPQSTRLFLVHLDYVVVDHLQLLRRLVITDALAIKQEAEGGHRHRNSLTVTFLQFPHLRGHLHLKVDLVAVLAYHLQFDVFAVAFGLGVLVCVGHCA